jgi:hypothetical protein
MDTNKEWLDQLMSTYTNMNNTVSEPVAETKEEVLNEECTECNESAEPQVEQTEEVEELEEETSNEDFMVSLLEDVQAAVGEDLTEEEIEAILETVSLVVEGMVKKMKKKY